MMNRRDLLALAVASALAHQIPAFASEEATPKPPIAQKRPKRIVQLGRTRIDDYAWLKDPQWKTVWRDPSVLRADIRSHLEAENRYADAMLEPTKPMQATLLDAMHKRMADEIPSPPQPDGRWAYYEYFVADADHRVHARRPRDGGAEQVLLDENARARGKAYYRVLNAQHS